MLEVEDALARALDGVAPLGTERVSTSDALGRVCAVDVYATRPQPPFANSGMDGYALRTADLQGDPPFDLAVAGESAAGRRTPLSVGQGEAIRTFTGAPVADGADAVVIQENTEHDGDSVRVLLRPEPGANIRPRGEDISDGQHLIERGQLISPGEIANLLTQGLTELEVFRRPRVHLISTGDELIPPGRAPAFGEITNSSIPMLAAVARQCGAIATELATIRDELELIKAGFEKAAKDTDLLVVTGGMSVG
ncbi:MAG: molybdopterin molybdotransferase MoeA, partial [Myxococcota bacterium]